MKREKQKILAVAIYAVAMALVEAIAVLYFRELVYPKGFFTEIATDSQILPWNILRLEMWREAATIVMLAVVGFLAFERWKEKLWAFILAFSIWDLAYYLFLYIFSRWPPSLGAIDVYFLIPQPWIGPVWIPILLFSFLGIFSVWKLFKLQSK